MIIGENVRGRNQIAAVSHSTFSLARRRFIVNCDPDDLAGFYGGEEFMELFCVLPFVGTLMMRGGTFDDEGNVHTTGIPGDMEVSMVFSDEDDEDGRTVWFNKRERFKDTFMGLKCWDMVSNFGFRTLPNKQLEVYHQGEYFVSNFPPISGVVYLVFKCHSIWLAFATSHHLKHHAFTSETDDEEEVRTYEDEAKSLQYLIQPSRSLVADRREVEDRHAASLACRRIAVQVPQLSRIQEAKSMQGRIAVRGGGRG